MATPLMARQPAGEGRDHDSLRIVLVGAVNSPHFEPIAIEMLRRGHSVHLAGYRSPGLPPSQLDPLELPYLELPAPVKRGLVRGAFALRRLVRSTAADVIHAHYLSRYTLPAALAGAAPAIFTAWGSDVLLPAPGRSDELYRRAILRLARRLTADSQALVDRLVELGVKRSRVELIRWGVDRELFRPPGEGERARLRSELGLGRGPVVLSPRIARPLYNVDVIVAAFERLASQHREVQLVIKHLDEEAPDLGGVRHRERIHLVGGTPYERMADYYRAADVCVSIPSSDSSPRSVWEAMACGTPCVVSDLPWVEELIEPGTHALVVPIEVEALARCLDELLRGPALRRELAGNGLTLVERHHDMRREMDRLEALYREVAGRGGSRSREPVA